MKPCGVVISRKPPTHRAFEFELLEPGSVIPGSYVEVPFEGGAVVARVTKVLVENPYMSTPGIVSAHAKFGLRLPSQATLEETEAYVARAEVVGVVDVKGEVSPPHVPPPPGAKVYPASPITLKPVLGLADKGVELGEAWGLGFNVTLDPEKLVWHHVAVLGATGSGKSYTCGVLAEEFLDLGLSVAIVDPHGEYRGLIETYGGRTVRLDKVLIEPDMVPPDAIADATEMTGLQRDLLHLAYYEVEEPGLEALEKAVYKVASQYKFHKETFFAIKRRLATLRSVGVFSGRGEPVDLEEERLVVVDAGVGLTGRVTSALVGALAWYLFEKRKRRESPPLVLIVDEAHKFLPQDEESFSKKSLRLVAREGRKFKAGLVIASQRVVRLDKDVLSQCGTKIVLRMDSPTDLAMLKPLLGRYTPILPSLPVGVALTAGIALRHPLIVKIRKQRKARRAKPGTLEPYIHH